MQPMNQLSAVLEEQKKFANELIFFWNELSQLNSVPLTSEGFQTLLNKWGGLTANFMDSSTNVWLLLADLAQQNPIYKTLQPK